MALTSESTPPTWPTIGHESREWVSRDDYGVRTDRRLGPQICNAAVPAIIADLVLGVPTDVAALAEDASVALTRFDAELQGEVAAFGAILLRSEAAASSRIEKLTASARDPDSGNRCHPREQCRIDRREHANDALDEYELPVQPVHAGHGPTLLAGLREYIQLELVDRDELRSGAVAVQYRPRPVMA